MSLARPACRGVLSRFSTVGSPRLPLLTQTPSVCHTFHSSAPLRARRKPRFSNVRAVEMGLVTPEDVEKFSEEKFPGYTPEEKKMLGIRYTKEQLEALEAGEAAIDARDLTIQGRLREDPAAPLYVDDYSTIQPIIDKRPRTKKVLKSTDARFMTSDEFSDDLFKWFESFAPPGMKREDLDSLPQEELERLLEKHGPTDEDVVKYFLDRPSLVGVTDTGNTALAPGLGDDIPGVTELYKKAADTESDEGSDPEGVYKDVRKLTGMTVKEIKATPTKVIVQRWVANQTRLGKIRSSDVIAVAGNRNGRVGIGVGRSVEPLIATMKARLAAIKNMRPIVRYEDRTIYGNVRAKISGTVVELSARPPGFGLRVPHRIFEICRVAGISDLAARIPRSRNPMNSVKATMKALFNQPNPEDIAIGRGKKLVDLRKVYYGGAVY